ncbi:replication factor C large subunit [Candidatus Woesearchaeota archaeon]|nr:MAG: replication factor C large subunit [Candidatus Woesearchaeota archaeon]
MKPWVLKHKPKKLSDIRGQNKALLQLKDFVLNHKSKKKKAAFIYGPYGCGKTSSVHALANELGYELIELNASDFRNQAAIQSIIGNALGQQSLFFKSKIILVDEVDGLSGTKDRGGISAIAKLIKNSPFPIIMTAHDAFDQRLKPLRKEAELIEFEELEYKTIFETLKKICRDEEISAEDNALKSLARQVGGDMRAAINDLQALSQYTGKLTDKEMESLDQREKTQSIQNALTLIFKTTNPEIAVSAFDNVDDDLDKCMLWIDENLPYEYKKPIDLSRAYDYVAKADVFRRRIKRRQDWRYLVYVNSLLTGGVSVSKDKKYDGVREYKQTKRLLKIWMANQKFLKRKAIAEKVAEKTHCSTRRAIQDIIPYLQIIFRKNKKMAGDIANSLELEREEIDWLKK